MPRPPWRSRTEDQDPPRPTPTTSPQAVPKSVQAAVQASRGEQVLATAQEDGTGHWLALTSWRLLEFSDWEGSAQLVLERGWHEVDTGSWDPDLWALSVLFVDRLEGRQWVLRDRTGPGQVPEVFRERVSASVVLTRHIDLGPRRGARVCVRKVLQTRELVDQVLLGRGARADDEELAQQVRLARWELRDQVGLTPEPPD